MDLSLLSAVAVAVGVFLGVRFWAQARKNDINKPPPPVCSICGIDISDYSIAPYLCMGCETQVARDQVFQRRLTDAKTHLESERAERVKALRNVAAGKPAKPPPQSWHKRLLDDDESPVS